MTISTSETLQAVEKSRIFSAALLVAGTCIGGGMLALPVETAHTGFFPSLAMLCACWLFMTLTGLLYVEVNLWMKGDAHIMTMAGRFLGLPGKIASVVLYLFMAYASLVAYTCGGGLLFQHTIEAIFSFKASQALASVLFAIVFGLMIFLGTHRIGRINALLVAGMIGAYVGLVGLGTSHIQPSYLFHQSWPQSFLAIPLILTTFSYQMIVPSLTPYLRRDPQAMRKAIIYGTTIPLIAYAFWQAVVLGAIPLQGVGGLDEALKNGQPSTESLRAFIGQSFFTTLGECFAFFALVTSYLGISLGLFDFLADMLKLQKQGKSKLLLGIMVVAPALIFALVYPKAFLFALEVSGGYGDALLNGILPLVMIWMGRYWQQLQGPYQMKGGKPLLVSLFLLALCFFGLQTAKFFL